MMQYTINPIKCLILFFSCFFCTLNFAFNSQLIEDQANLSISKLYHRLNAMPNTSMSNRIAWISAQFKGRTYVLGALGEGPKARYDQFPLYRVDAFDCDTYVNTIIALALADSPNSFQYCINAIRYNNAKVSYINRNHFTSIDWNKNNQIRGVLKDVTLNIKNKNHQPIAKFAEALIDKPNWYRHKGLSTIRLSNNDTAQQKLRLKELKNKGIQLKAVRSRIPYLPLTALFSKDAQPRMSLFSQIPDGAIIEIVRPNWDLRKQTGTALNVSHMGFAIWVNGQLFFREASSMEGKVVDILMVDYLKNALKNPTIKGINVEVVVPTRPGGCVI